MFIYLFIFPIFRTKTLFSESQKLERNVYDIKNKYKLPNNTENKLVLLDDTYTVNAVVTGRGLLGNAIPKHTRGTPDGFVMSSTKNDLKKLERELDGKWGSYKLFER